MLHLSLLVLSLSSFASIFNGDDRQDFHQIKTQAIKEISNSIPSLILKSKLRKDGDFYHITAKTLQKGHNFCEDTPFSDEYQLANCSASLVGENTILTAAHCLDKEKNSDYHISKYYIVFDYKKTKEGNLDKIKAENVFEIKSMPYYDFNWSTMNDIAILKLKRSTSNRTPLKIDFNHNYHAGTKLFILGYPLGISQKLTSDGDILDVKASKNSFRHHLDMFSVNSGSAIFDLESKKIIGVHARGTGSNYKKYGRSCNEWQVGIPFDDFGEGNMLSKLKKIITPLL